MILKIISTDDLIFEGEITTVTLPGAMGAFSVLKNHASLISTLTSGKILFTPADGNVDVQEHEIDGGIVNVDNNVVSVCLY